MADMKPDIKGNPMVNPDDMTVNGHPIIGWAHGRWQGRRFLRRALELFMPKRLESGDEAVPLIDGRRALPEPREAPPMPPVAPPKVLGQNGPAPAERPPIPAGPPPKPVGPPNVIISANLVPTGLPPKLQELRRTCKINRNLGQTTIPIEVVLQALEE